jgi:hypothetical protein
MVSERSEVGLLARSSEIRMLKELATAAQSRQGSAVVIRGGGGIGETALIGELVESAPELRTVRAVGVLGGARNSGALDSGSRVGVGCCASG